jgi:hypothetical protein
MLHAADLAHAERLLGVARSRPVQLREVEEFRAERVVRCAVAGADETVVVKVADRGGDPEKGIATIHAELAALELLRALGSTRAARLLADDADAGILVIEDLGDERSLADLLLDADAAGARAGAVASATALGQLHAETVGRAADFYARRARLAIVDPERDRFWLRGLDVRTLVDQLPTLAARYDLPAPDGTADDLATVVGEMAEPGDLLVLSTGDPCPDNERATPAGVRLFDFDGATFRHALVDAAHYVLPYPNCWCWRALPADVTAAMLAAHRAPLARVSTQAADDARYTEALVRTCAAWVLWVLAANLRRVDDEPLSSTRVVESLTNFTTLAAPTRHLPAFREWCGAVLVDRRAAWPDATAAAYPAFGGPAWPEEP